MPIDRAPGILSLLGALAMVSACASDGSPEADTTTAAGEAAPEAGPAEGTAGSSGRAPDLAQGSSGNGLGVSEGEVFQVFADSGLDPAAFESMDLGDGRQVVAASFPESTDRQVLWVAMIGGEDPHTIRLDYFPLAAEDDERPRVGEAMDGLMQAVFPTWEQGVNWPEAAGQAAWQGAVQVAEEARANRAESVQIPIAEMERDGIWLSALSIPGQNLSYVLTTKSSCRPSNPASQFAAGFAGCT